MKARLQFKNAAPLLFRGGLSELLDGDPPPALSLSTVQGWKRDGVARVFLARETPVEGSSSARNLERLRSLAEGAGIRIEIASPALVRERAFARLQSLARRIQHQIREGACLLLYDAQTAAAGAAIGASFLLTLRAASDMQPTAALDFMKFPADAPGAADARQAVHEFKHFLDPAYQPPEPPPEAEAALDDPPATATDASGADDSAAEAESPGPASEDDAFDDADRSFAPPPPSEPQPAAPREPAFASAANAVAEQGQMARNGNGRDHTHAPPVEFPTAGSVGTPPTTAEAAPGADEPVETSTETPAPASRADSGVGTPTEEPASPAEDGETPAEATVAPGADEPVETSAETPATAAPEDAGTPAKRPDAALAATRSSFKAGRFTIGVKLLSIISGLLVTALGVSIFIASSFFQSSTQARIEENNLQTVRILSQRVESELRNIGYKAHLMALTLDQNIGTPAEQQLYKDLFFQNNNDFIFLGVAERGDGGLNFRRTLYNESYMESNNVSREDLQRISDASSRAFLPSFNGAFVVHNASRGSVPMLGISLPVGASIVVLYLEPSQFLKSFQIQGIIDVFMVNTEGDVIASEESKVVLARENRKSTPIVEQMLKDEVGNGLTQYEDENGVTKLGAFQRLGIGGLGVIATVERDAAFAAVRSIRNTNLLIMAIVTGLSIIVVVVFARSLTTPILELVGATQKIEAGDYDVEIEPLTGDEIGSLTHSFRSMAVGLQEREKMKDAFGKFVNKEIAERVLRGEIKLGGEEKIAAVFFSDLRGFTAMSEKMTPEQVVSYLNEYFTDMVSCINATDGVVDKYIGDAIMAHWGAIVSKGNDTENAINAALMMRKALIAFNERRKPGEPMAKMGSGINTGPLISGQIGSDERLEYTVIGDAVNLASRIEALNKPFGTDVLISQDSYDLVKGIFKVEAQPAIKVKGKTEPQTIYAVVGRLDDPDCPRDMRQVREMLGIEFDESKAVDPDAKEEKFEVVGKG